MSVYLSLKEWPEKRDGKEEEGGEDFIVKEKFNTVHPRGVVRLRRGTGDGGRPIYHTYNTSDDSIVGWLNRGGFDPLTREPFTESEKERIRLYNQCYNDYPDRTIEGLKEWIPKLYEAWVDTYVNPKRYTGAEKKRIGDEADCFLQFEDIAGAFLASEPDAFNNRGRAEERLGNEPVGAWLVRKSSIKDDDSLNLYAYVVTTKVGGSAYTHVPLVHSYGKGIYRVKASRGWAANQALVDSPIYPTALSFLKGMLAGMDKSILVLNKIREKGGDDGARVGY